MRKIIVKHIALLLINAFFCINCAYAAYAKNAANMLAPAVYIKEEVFKNILGNITDVDTLYFPIEEGITLRLEIPKNLPENSALKEEKIIRNTLACMNLLNRQVIKEKRPGSQLDLQPITKANRNVNNIVNSFLLYFFEAIENKEFLDIDLRIVSQDTAVSPYYFVVKGRSALVVPFSFIPKRLKRQQDAGGGYKIASDFLIQALAKIMRLIEQGKAGTLDSKIQKIISSTIAIIDSQANSVEIPDYVKFNELNINDFIQEHMLPAIKSVNWQKDFDIRIVSSYNKDKNIAFSFIKNRPTIIIPLSWLPRLEPGIQYQVLNTRSEHTVDEIITRIKELQTLPNFKNAPVKALSREKLKKYIKENTIALVDPERGKVLFYEQVLKKIFPVNFKEIEGQVNEYLGQKLIALSEKVSHAVLAKIDIRVVNNNGIHNEQMDIMAISGEKKSLIIYYDPYQNIRENTLVKAKLAKGTILEEHINNIEYKYKNGNKIKEELNIPIREFLVSLVQGIKNKKCPDVELRVINCEEIFPYGIFIYDQPTIIIPVLWFQSQFMQSVLEDFRFGFEEQDWIESLMDIAGRLIEIKQATDKNKIITSEEKIINNTLLHINSKNKRVIIPDCKKLYADKQLGDFLMNSLVPIIQNTFFEEDFNIRIIRDPDKKDEKHIIIGTMHNKTVIAIPVAQLPENKEEEGEIHENFLGLIEIVTNYIIKNKHTTELKKQTNRLINQAI
ncbi:MAG: hypothetical protein ABIG64_03845 [Candidatus Omnitrophota bacterium]